MRKTLTRAAVAAAAVLAFALGAGIPAASASPSPPPLPPGVQNITTPLPAPAFSPASPLTDYCASGQLQVQWDNVIEEQVDQWWASGNYFIAPPSGHTILCQRLGDYINGNWYYEYAAVISINGGPVKESNDCVSSEGRAKDVNIGLNGCSPGKAELLWALFGNIGESTTWIVSDAADSCVLSVAEYGPLYQNGTSTDGNSCLGMGSAFDYWGVFTG